MSDSALQLVPQAGAGKASAVEDPTCIEFARSLSTKLAAYMRVAVEFKHSGRRSLAAKGLPQECTGDACWADVRLEVEGDAFFLELERSLAFAALELLTGGKGRNPASIGRDLTQIEKRLLEEFVRMILRELAVTCAVAAPAVSIHAMESRITAVAARLGRQHVILNEFQTTLAATTGIMRLITTFEITSSASVKHEAEEVAMNPDVLELILPSQLNVEVCLDPFEMNVLDLRSLHPEQLIRLATPLNAPVRATVNGERAFDGQIVSTGSNRAFQLTRSE